MRGFTPAGVFDLELGPPRRLWSPLGRRLDEFERARVLVRLHGRPLGFVDVDRPTATNVEEQARRELAGVIAATPACLAGRRPAEAPPATVVVATRERPSPLARCLAALAALEYPDVEVIVVDNAPRTDATRDVTASFPGVRCVREDVPGLAAAHNRGLAEAGGAVVAFTDDDVVVDRHWLAELVAPFRADARVACVTGLIAPAALDTPEQMWQEEYWGFDKGFARRVFAFGDRGEPLHPYAAGSFGSGASMAFRTDVLRSLGGFDPALGAGAPGFGGDDLAAFFDVLAAGHRLVYEPAAVAYHEHRREYDALRAQAYGYGAGLTAYLTKLVVDRPGRAATLAWRAPRGVAHALGARSAKNARRPAGYPRELTWIERRGMLHGPFAYLRGRRRRRALYG